MTNCRATSRRKSFHPRSSKSGEEILFISTVLLSSSSLV